LAARSEARLRQIAVAANMMVNALSRVSRLLSFEKDMARSR
jgi:hypothetical protein